MVKVWRRTTVIDSDEWTMYTNKGTVDASDDERKVFTIPDIKYC